MKSPLDSPFFVITVDPKGLVLFHELSPTVESQRGEFFCLIPYSNPKKHTPDPIFFLKGEKQELRMASDKHLSPSVKLRASLSKEEYVKTVCELKKHIQLGDVYEINFCMEFFAENTEINPLDIFLKWNEKAKAPYSYYLRVEDEHILCASPELFLRKEGNMLFTKPIKGTAPRGNSGEEDEKMKSELFNNKKERTENVMAVDVARNDLSVVAKRGTVKVNKLYNIETYETVHQMVSTVSCELLESKELGHILEATFPMASMTGAPKQSAMDLIDKFEKFERNHYSGAMGFVNENGDFELCVVIRSIFFNQKNKRLYLAVGSAITHFSDPEKEYEECLLKADGMLKVLRG